MRINKRLISLVGILLELINYNKLILYFPTSNSIRPLKNLTGKVVL